MRLKLLLVSAVVTFVLLEVSSVGVSDGMLSALVMVCLVGSESR